MSERIVEVPVAGRTIKFECPSEVCYQRSLHILKKEPGTIAWIDGFAPGEVFWDIGANIGQYSLYAAVARQCRVIAIEPASTNYYILNRNIVLNRLDHSVAAICVAIDRSVRFDMLRMRDSEIGSALHVFGSNIDYAGKAFEEAWLQGCLGVPIDYLCDTFGVPLPHHVKIDVDGLEVSVVEGGAKTFRNAILKSVLVEVDLKDSKEVQAISRAFRAAGLWLDEHVPNNVPRPHPNGPLIANLIFRR